MGSEAAAGGHDIEWLVLSISSVQERHPSHPFLEAFRIEIDFLVVIWIVFFEGRMASTDTLAYSLLLLQKA